LATKKENEKGRGGRENGKIEMKERKWTNSSLWPNICLGLLISPLPSPSFLFSFLFSFTLPSLILPSPLPSLALPSHPSLGPLKSS